ncbi:RagB/SusD family nutrient uptake outer membrane protein [Mangrovibacterium diazotrophicum]|uniref:Putative outer membrane starch-binding protein n=1 Tax=Mangrovibacterium diazotrophicum TaxID=1261403 RepID=A0A419W620_9BACT|nr:RagB/SusD family nutrient uptake outer membrane protein [Mangrovibacterium diazotrophicum]RKD90895.1 putative outer membrane starch-binding protein [Mangrovibacterium diazotrophicum]
MRKFNTIVALLVTGLLFTMCNEDLLDIDQQSVANLDSYYANATDADAESLIAYVYADVYNVTGYFWVNLLNSLSDDSPSTGGLYSNINVNASNHTGNQYFTNFYNINYLCNLIIEKLEPDSEVKTQIIGEAYFWRAYAYTNLIRLWGNPPLVDHVLTASELTPENGTTEELWNYVETSLQEAITRLPEKSGLGGQQEIGGRVTLHSAHALLGKAQLLKGDYTGAIASLEKVISSGKYDLIDDFTELYHMSADFCDEYMWEWNVDDNSTASTYMNEGDFRFMRFTWNTANVTVPGGITEQGVSGADLNKDFYDFMVARGEKGKSRYFGTIWDYEDILQRFVDLDLATDAEDAVSKFWKTDASMINCQGYFRSKMLAWSDEVVPDSREAGLPYTYTNWPGMRYAEVLLLYSEACTESGTKISEGLAALNQVRVRAGLSALGSLDLQDVKDEKRAELAFEGERYLDLIRWGDAPTALANRGITTYTFYGYVSGTSDYDVDAEDFAGASGFQSGRDELFPYPYSETLLNPNLVQNNGW